MSKGISLDLSKVEPYMKETEINYMEEMVKAAHEKLHMELEQEMIF